LNLWLRLLWLLVTFRFRGKLTAPFGVSRLSFRVWPHDLDTSLHMNNGRYWTLMDLGRTDLMLRLGLGGAVLKHGWTPVVSAAKIRFRRELRLGRAFTLETRILCWEDTTVVMEHRLVSIGGEGQTILHAVALVKAGLYDRKVRGFVPMARLMQEMGISESSPSVPPDVEAFLHAETEMKRHRQD
jgi:acyl-CoA thioesterase FadM